MKLLGAIKENHGERELEKVKKEVDIEVKDFDLKTYEVAIAKQNAIIKDLQKKTELVLK